MRKYNCIWILLYCLIYVGITSCFDKKNSTDKLEIGVSTILPDAKNEVRSQPERRRRPTESGSRLFAEGFVKKEINTTLLMPLIQRN